MAFKKQALKGVFWTFTEQLGVKGVGFVVQILIARLLLPEDFGLIAMIAVFIGLGDLLVDSGLGRSLIRTKEPQQADFSTIFYLNIISAIIIYLLLYVLAPYVADFYGKTELLNILRVISLAIIFGSFSIVQRAILTISMNFKNQMLIQIPSLLTSSIIGLILAYNGHGVWSIVFMKLLYPFFASVLYWIYSDWRPIWMFDMDKLKYHYLFGYKLMITYMLNAFFNDIFSVFIGKYYSTNILGFYNRAITFQRFPTMLVGKSISKVSYPLFSKVNEDMDELKKIIRKTNKLIAYFFVPLLFFLIFNAQEIIVLLLTEKWTNITPFFQILCLGAFLEPMTHYYSSVINSFGDSGLVLKISFYLRILTLIGLLFITKTGVYPIVIFQTLSVLLNSVIFMYYVGRKINYRLVKQFQEMLPELSISVCSSVLIYFLSCWMNFNGICSVIIHLLSFVVFYIIISETFKLTTYVFVKKELLAVINK